MVEHLVGENLELMGWGEARLELDATALSRDSNLDAAVAMAEGRASGRRSSAAHAGACDRRDVGRRH